MDVLQTLEETLSSGRPEEDLLELLTKRIQELMLQSPPRLFQVLYRLDVDEKQARAALTAAEPARALAQVIYRRHLLRLEMRRRFNPNSPNNK